MHATRRHVLAAALATGLSGRATAQTRPMRIVVPYPPGGASDVLGRILARQYDDEEEARLEVEYEATRERREWHQGL